MITKIIKSAPITYSKFREWMIKNVYKTERSYEGFIKLSDTYKYNSFILYLEREHKVPILDALLFYSKVRYVEGFNNQLQSMIIYEFMRIEQDKITDYNIF